LELRSRLNLFEIPKLLLLEQIDLQKGSNVLFDQINDFFSGKSVVIRSSAKDEDGFHESSAGKYHSELNVSSKDKDSIFNALQQVVASYSKSGSSDLNHQVIVQEMVTETIMSGVLFTHELSSGAPYYVINYDDVTGRTDSVTSGTGEYSNRTLYIRRDGKDSIRSQRFKHLISAVKELEYILNSKNLDIEFAMNDKFEPKLFQVRSLTGTQKWDCKELKKFNALTDSTRNKLNIALKTAPGIFGASNLFGQMPDWNPTEMIGRVPRKLAFSLYEELITNGPWLEGRSQMGYHRPNSSKLMLSFAGQPYIDVRLSFNSFLPSGIPPKIGEKLVNSWLSKLNESPQYHDKVEFEIVTTCYDFDFDGKANKLLGSVLDKEELYDFKIRLKDLTYPLLRGECDAAIKKCLDKIRKLEAKQNRVTFPDTSLNDLIQDCIKLGTIPFAMLARHGFIASSILESLKRLEIFDDSDVSAFHASTETVASKLVQDMSKLADSAVEKKKFVDKYGHLRPGTYDILSPSYSQLSIEELSLSTDRPILKKQNPFHLNSKQKQMIDQLLEKEGCTDFSAVGLIDYIRQAIEGREYGKFVFTRSVSAILESIANWGKALGVSKEMLSHLSISEVKYFQSEALADPQVVLEHLTKAVDENKEKWKLSRSIRLPQLLADCEGVDVVPFQVSQPNFISSKKITGEVMFLDTGFTSDQITGKVILIENADPGFDWIFSQEIIALITKYGGANSHMAIRCAEFGIPAAIGCGEQRFETLKKARSIVLDCSSRILTPLFQKDLN